MELLGLPMDAIPFIPLRVNVTPEVTFRTVYRTCVFLPYLCVPAPPGVLPVQVLYRYRYVQYANVGVWYR